MANTPVNPHRGEVVIEDFGGRDRILRFDMNALAEFEELCGAPIHEALGRPGISVIRNALMVGLKRDYGRIKPPINVAMIGRWMDASKERLGEITEAVVEAVSLALPKRTDEDEDAPPDPPKRVSPASETESESTSSELG